jgi:hypothetical protein
MNKQFGQHSYTFEDINDVHEVWEFVDLSLMPTVIKHKDEVARCVSLVSLSLSLSLVKYILAPIIPHHPQTIGWTLFTDGGVGIPCILQSYHWWHKIHSREKQG